MGGADGHLICISEAHYACMWEKVESGNKVLMCKYYSGFNPGKGYTYGPIAISMQGKARTGASSLILYCLRFKAGEIAICSGMQNRDLEMHCSSLHVCNSVILLNT